MKLTAEYLESKGWKKLDGYTWVMQFGIKEYGLKLGEQEEFDMYVDDTIAYVFVAYNIHTQSRFDRLWSAITEQD